MLSLIAKNNWFCAEILKITLREMLVGCAGSLIGTEFREREEKEKRGKGKRGRGKAREGL